jgi:hypothetical protein
MLLRNRIQVPPAADQSPVERLHQAVQSHQAGQHRALVELRRLQFALGDRIAKFLLAIVAEGKARQLELLGRIEASLRDSIAWTRSAKALPDGCVGEQADVVRAADDCLRLERESELGSRQLAEAYQDLNAGLDQLLLRSIAQESAVHQRILCFVLARLRKHQEHELAPGLPAKQVDRQHIVIRRLVPARAEAFALEYDTQRER